MDELLMSVANVLRRQGIQSAKLKVKVISEKLFLRNFSLATLTLHSLLLNLDVLLFSFFNDTISESIFIVKVKLAFNRILQHVIFLYFVQRIALVFCCALKVLFNETYFAFNDFKSAHA